MHHVLKSAPTPIVWVMLLVAMGLIIAKCPRKRSAPKLGWCLVFVGVLTLYLFSIDPISRALAYPLEARYKSPSDQVLSALDIVVILGRGMEPSGGLRDYAEPSGATYSRLVSGVKILKRSGATALVLSGGGPTKSRESEAGVMKDLALELGVRKDGIITEEDSRNTMEQAIRVAALLSQTKGRRIGLVTSALHLRWSQKAFGAHFPEETIVPIPVGHDCGPGRWQIMSFIPTATELSVSTWAVHEWLGLIWYPIRY